MLSSRQDEAVWHVTEHAWIYVVADAERAGKALLTILVDNLEDQVAQLAARGLPVGPIETMPGAARKVTISDPEGNTITYLDSVVDSVARRLAAYCDRPTPPYPLVRSGSSKKRSSGVSGCHSGMWTSPGSISSSPSKNSACCDLERKNMRLRVLSQNRCRLSRASGGRLSALACVKAR